MNKAITCIKGIDCVRKECESNAEKISNYIVNKRIPILALMLTGVSIFCSRFVEVNEDMTKYLPDDSNMKSGMDTMENALPEMETSGTICNPSRVVGQIESAEYVSLLC